MQFSFHVYLALKVIDQPGRDLHQGRFASAILAHQGVDFTGPQIKVHLSQHRGRPETL